MSKYIIVDVEADGPIPGIDQYSMVCFGAVALNKHGIQKNVFYGETRPISEKWNPESLAISGFNREHHLSFSDPLNVMLKFEEWISTHSGGKPIFISDNLAFDWQWINFYFHKYLGRNPFGWSGQRIGDKFQGYFNDPYFRWKKFRKTKHDHDPVNDALANAEALLYIKEQGLKLF